jgi:hypothetical protein
MDDKAEKLKRAEDALMGFQGSQVLAAFDGGQTVHVRQYQMVLVQKAIKENVRALALYTRSPRPVAAGPMPRRTSLSTGSLDSFC